MGPGWAEGNWFKMEPCSKMEGGGRAAPGSQRGPQHRARSPRQHPALPRSGYSRECPSAERRLRGLRLSWAGRSAALSLQLPYTRNPARPGCGRRLRATGPRAAVAGPGAPRYGPRRR